MLHSTAKEQEFYLEYERLYKSNNVSCLWEWSEPTVCEDSESEFYTLRLVEYGFILYLSKSIEFDGLYRTSIVAFKGYKNHYDLQYIVNKYPNESYSDYFLDQKSARVWISTWKKRIYHDHLDIITSELILIEKYKLGRFVS